MPLDVRDIKPQRGKFFCNLWENSNIGLPLTLFYSIEIPLDSFDSGHTYVPQPTNTSVVMEWLRFSDLSTPKNETNWKNLVGREFLITYEDDTGEGSIYLGTEHCQFNSRINFLSLVDTTFDIELTLKVAFNIDTINLDANGEFSIYTKVDFKGLLLYDNKSLPSFAMTTNAMELITNFISKEAYESELVSYENSNVQWRQLKPKT